MSQFVTRANGCAPKLPAALRLLPKTRQRCLVATEAAWLAARGRTVRRQLGDGSAVLTGVLLALALPPLTPWWVPVVGGACAIVLGNLLADLVSPFIDPRIKLQ